MKMMFEKLTLVEKVLVGYLNGNYDYKSYIAEIAEYDYDSNYDYSYNYDYNYGYYCDDNYDADDYYDHRVIIEDIEDGELNDVIKNFESGAKTMKIQVALGYLNFAIQKQATSLATYLLEIINKSEAKDSYDEFLVRQEKIVSGIQLPTVEDLAYSWEVVLGGNDIFLSNYAGLEDSIFVPCKTENGMKITLGKVNSKYVTSVIMADGMTYVEKETFNHCHSLVDVSIPEGVTAIGCGAFQHCHSLVNVVIPETVRSIGDRAFMNCSDLEYVSIPENVSSIGERAFMNCSDLEYVSIPENVSSIGDGAFHSCWSLENISIPENVLSIGDSAFYDCRSLETIGIPEAVTSIGPYAFSGCNSLVEITIPENVSSIGSYAFGWCRSLIKITIPETLNVFGRRAFHGCFYGCESSIEVAIPTSE